MLKYRKYGHRINAVMNRAGQTAFHDYARFLGAWVRKPLQTASVVPSSRHLARLMVSDIDPHDGRVMELGGGTGALTKAILATGLPPEKLEVVEIDAALASNLRRKFPGVSILEDYAQSVSAHAAGELGSYQMIVSGLPLLAMDRSLQHAILSEAFSLLRPGGTLVQFTYSPRPPVGREVLKALGLEVHQIGHTLRNFPPATVFRFTRKV